MHIKKNIIQLLLVLCSCSISAQNITLLRQFNGRYDFTMIGNTLNPFENESAVSCFINTSSSAVLELPETVQIEKAYLYWAGSGTGDITVTLNNTDIVAERNFVNNFFNIPFFSCFADVTNLVQNNGNGSYLLSNLDLTDVISSYCSSGINFGGWAIVIIYKSDDLPINQLNIYDGLESVYGQNPELIITINDLNVIDNQGAKIGFLAWEGDAALAVNETLQINGNIVSNPPLNPPTNVFNGTNSFAGATDLYNMDLDFYNMEDFIQIGDTQAEIKLTSGQDFVMVNAIVTKLNSQLPDAVVAINQIEEGACFQHELQLRFTVINQNGTGVLPQNTPISLYINNVLSDVFYTSEDLQVGESEVFNQIISVLAEINESFDVKLVVDDDGAGNSIITEIDENNNEANIDFQFTKNCLPVIPQLFTPSLDTNNTFYIDGLRENFKDFELFIYNRYGNLIFKGNRNNPDWNGTYKGKKLPTATYFYTLYLHNEDEITYKGWVYLLK